MNEILKEARLVEAAGPDEREMELINAQALRALSPEEVFTFRLAACDNVIDRDNEQFSARALEQMAELYVGKPVLMDHTWSAKRQTARVYAARVEAQGDYQRLVLSCYCHRSKDTEEVIAAIESGVLRECSVGLAVNSVLCSVCGADLMDTVCGHRPGMEYDGVRCHRVLDSVADVYEVSLVAVPAQPAAGVVKAKRYGGTEGPEEALMLARARMELEMRRF